MKRQEYNSLRIASRCRRPDPLTCYEQLTRCQASISYDDRQAEPCLRCPVAAWLAAMVLTGTSREDGVRA